MTAPFSSLPYREGNLILWPSPPARPGNRTQPPSDPFISVSREDPELSPPPIRGRVASPHKHLTFLLLFLRFASTNAPPRSPTHIPKALLQFKRKPPFYCIT
uniref:Uncharacterized protein n=1 Tax=Vitis vinifera TaxID=29760 RepID=F6HMJ8_VITVI